MLHAPKPRPHVKCVRGFCLLLFHPAFARPDTVVTCVSLVELVFAPRAPSKEQTKNTHKTEKHQKQNKNVRRSVVCLFSLRLWQANARQRAPLAKFPTRITTRLTLLSLTPKRTPKPPFPSWSRSPPATLVRIAPVNPTPPHTARRPSCA